MALCPTFVSQSCVPPKNQHFKHEKTLDKQGLNLNMVPQVRIGLTTPSLPRTCATTTLLRLWLVSFLTDFLKKVKYKM